KVSELKQKDNEIKALKRNLGDSQKNFLGKKLKSKKERLELLAAELGENKISNINIAKENIAATQDGLIERGISISKAQKFCRKYKKQKDLLPENKQLLLKEIARLKQALAEYHNNKLQ
ncbi:22342_t:CDS:2, partial [Dentiscutata erythropus]